MFKNQEVNLSGPRFTIVWPDGIGRAHHLPLDEAKSSVSCEELHREVLNIIDKLTSRFHTKGLIQYSIQIVSVTLSNFV